MKSKIAMLLAVLGCLSIRASEAVTLHYEITNVKTPNFVEFKAESDQKGEQATGHILNGQTRTGDWDLGQSNQNIWFWFDTLVGKASIKLSIDGTTILDVDCNNGKFGEVRVTNSAYDQRVWKNSGSPRFEDDPNRNTSWVRF